jgi:hypothetical protein
MIQLNQNIINKLEAFKEHIEVLREIKRLLLFKKFKNYGK